MSWECNCNSEININFASELQKEEISKGSWTKDYEYFVQMFGIRPCPFFCASNESVTLRGCIVDDCSLKVCLLACCTVGSNIKKIIIRDTKITLSQVDYLCSCIEKLASLEVLKLEYVTISDGEICGNDSIKKLFGSILNIQYLSVRGNKWGDSVFASLLPLLSTNFTLRALDISDNLLSDISFKLVLSSLKLNTTLELLNLSSNNITGSSLIELENLLFGSPFSGEDEGIIKSLNKTIGDRNKAIKDLNKKRKKSNQVEINEFSLTPAQVVKVNNENRIINTKLRQINLNFNSLDPHAISSALESWKSMWLSASEAIQTSFITTGEKKRLSLFLKDCSLPSSNDLASFHDSVDIQF